MFIGSLWQRAMLEHDGSAKRAVRWAVGILVVAMPILAELAYSRDYGYHETPLPYILSYTAGLGCFSIFTVKVRFRARWLVHMGTISYSIYLMHTPVMIAIMAAGLVPDGAVAPWVQWAWVAAMMALVILTAHVTYLCVERPFVAAGRRLIAQHCTPKPERVASAY